MDDHPGRVAARPFGSNLQPPSRFDASTVMTSRSARPALLFILPLTAAIVFATPTLAHELAYVATLSGPNEFPANNSAGVGTVVAIVDLDLFTLELDVHFSGLSGTATASHIHGLTDQPLTGLANVATMLPSFVGFPAGIATGDYSHTFDLTNASSYNPAFISANGGTISSASNALFRGFAQGRTYLNIHTTAFPGGEIRGFLLPDPKSDFNHDGIVNGDDLAIWRESLGVDAEGDANDSEDTEGSDFLIWQRQQGSVAGIGGPPAIAVPEPICAQLAIAVALVVGRWRRRHVVQKVFAKNGCRWPAEC